MYVQFYRHSKVVYIYNADKLCWKLLMCLFLFCSRAVKVEASTGVGQPGSLEGMQSTAESEAGQSKEEEEEGVAGRRGCDQSLGSPELGILAEVEGRK
jgi:hypothetical protein